MVFFDRATEKSKPMSDQVRGWLEGGLREEEKEEL